MRFAMLIAAAAVATACGTTTRTAQGPRAREAAPAPVRRNPPAPPANVSKEAAVPAPPKWDDPAAVRYIWPQIAGLAEAGVLCPYVYPKDDLPGQYTSVAYDGQVSHAGPYSLHVAFHAAPGVSGSWGVGCLRRYDASRYAFLSFWVRSRPGQTVHVRLRDSEGAEAIVEKIIPDEGWRRVTVPTTDFAGVNLRALTNLGLVFDEAVGETDLYLDDVAFTNE